MDENISKENKGIELIVGLGNPGPAYAKTRHNAGAWFVEALCEEYRITLKNEPKFNARVGNIKINGRDVRVLLSNTYMNLSGQPVGGIVNYYHIPVSSVLVAHDELDIPTGSVRLKIDGGHGGHNGLRDIINHLKDRNFYRLRLGIGHPGDKTQVMEYVLNNPSAADEKLIRQGIDKVLKIVPQIVAGDLQNSMTKLHTT